VTPVFPLPLALVKACRGCDHQQQCLSQKSYYRKEIVEKGKLKTAKLFSVKAKETRCRKQAKKRKEDLGTRVGERPVRRACPLNEGSMLMKSRSRQAFGQGVGDIEWTPTCV